MREFVELAFNAVDKQIEWNGDGVNEIGIDRKSGKCLIEIDPRYFRPNEVDFLLGDASKAQNRLGWKHTTDLEILSPKWSTGICAILCGRLDAMTSTADQTPRAVYSLLGKKVFVAGHTGMVGSAILRRLQSIDCEVISIAHSDLDLTRQSPTEQYIAHHKPDVVIVAAARVGGILANSQYPADFLYDNLTIGINVIRAAHLSNVERLLWLGSSCIYPRMLLNPCMSKHC